MFRIQFALSSMISLAFAFNPPPDIVLECQMRQLLYNTSVQRLPWCETAPQRVYDALRLQECPGSENLLLLQKDVKVSSSLSSTTSSSYTLYVDADIGNDVFDGSSPSSALLTLEEARSRARELRKTIIQTSSSEKIIVELSGVFHLKRPLLLDQLEDSNTTWKGRNSQTVISGGIPLSSLSWNPSTLYPAPVLEASLPDGVPYDGYGLFDGDTGRRLPCAREPNGNVETQMQPTGWALVRGNPNGTLSPPIPGEFEHVEVTDFARNESVFPIWGRDFDPRNPGIGYVWYGQGNGTPSWFEGGRTFWANKTVDRGLRWNATGGPNPRTGLVASPFNATGWNPSSKGRRAHVFHNGLWGHWTYYVDQVDSYSETMTFSEGGWQEGRGGGMSTQPFYVEGVMEALDVPSEWYIERERGVIHLFPNSTNPPNLLVVPVLENVLTISNSAQGVTLEDLTFKFTTDGLMEKYYVGAPGDWSVRRSGAVIIDSAANASVIGCVWNRTNGNSLLITGSSQNTFVEECDFYIPGGCGIAVVGYAPRSNVDDPDASIPANIVITSSIFEGIGVYGKQTSALFTTVAGAVTLSDSVLFSGPRSGININDGAFGNKIIERNVLFDWVRETQDHSAFNTWDRQNFVHSDGSQAAGWNRIVNNAIFNGPSPNRDLGNLWPCLVSLSFCSAFTLLSFFDAFLISLVLTSHQLYSIILLRSFNSFTNLYSYYHFLSLVFYKF